MMVLNEVFEIYKKFIENNATHNTSQIDTIIDKEDVVTIGYCNDISYHLDGLKFKIEDIYGEITTKAAKFTDDITKDDLKGRLIIFKGYAQDGMFTVKEVNRTKIKVVPYENMKEYTEIEVKEKLDLFAYILRNGPIRRTEAINKFNVSARTIDRYTFNLLEKQYILKDTSEIDPLYTLNWDFFDYLSTQKKPEYRKGNIDEILNELE